MKSIVILLLQFVFVGVVSAQFSQADSLRGGIGEGRYWWDLIHYDLNVTFDIDKKEIQGFNTITFEYEAGTPRHQVEAEIFQIDLQQPLVLDSIRLLGCSSSNAFIIGSSINRIGNAYLLNVPSDWISTSGTYSLTVFYHGKPREAVNPPWDGGLVWEKDANGKPWVTVACQGLGASVWFPCKDSQVDEPKSVNMHYTCDSKLMCVSNGRFVDRKEHKNGTSTYSWEVLNPINNYNMIPYIGDYVNLHEHYAGEKGILELDYWVLRGNEEKAKAHFKEVPRMLEALEYWFGPYPFYEDGYKLVEAPHLGMEHQSAIAYGNNFQNGYFGKDLSGTGEGLKWDFIIVHESGHEWYGNNITSEDIADMWIHESFTNYSETLFMDYWFGTEAANTYCKGLRKKIVNDIPIIGPYGVNKEGSGDMYYKGANMLHTIRQLVSNDSVFRLMLREMNTKFYHQTVTTDEIEHFMSDYLKMDLSLVFDQYLRTKNPPTLEVKYYRNHIKYRWVDCVKWFDMPIYFDQYGKFTATSKWKKLAYTGFGVPVVNANLYVRLKRAAPKSNGLRVE